MLQVETIIHRKKITSMIRDNIDKPHTSFSSSHSSFWLTCLQTNTFVHGKHIRLANKSSSIILVLPFFQMTSSVSMDHTNVVNRSVWDRKCYAIVNWIVVIGQMKKAVVSLYNLRGGVLYFIGTCVC